MVSGYRMTAFIFFNIRSKPEFYFKQHKKTEGESKHLFGFDALHDVRKLSDS